MNAGRKRQHLGREVTLRMGFVHRLAESLDGAHRGRGHAAPDRDREDPLRPRVWQRRLVSVTEDHLRSLNQTPAPGLTTASAVRRSALSGSGARRRSRPSRTTSPSGAGLPRINDGSFLFPRASFDLFWHGFRSFGRRPRRAFIIRANVFAVLIQKHETTRLA